MPADRPVERIDPPWAAGEKETLVAFLRYHRATLRQKCEGLTPQQLVQRAMPPSTLCLLGLVRHLSEVEVGWLRARFDGEAGVRLYYSEGDPDADFDVFEADQQTVADAWAVYGEQIARVDQIIERGELDEMAKLPTRQGDLPSLRWILVHLIEEYARHNGHADLLREAIDGTTGE